MWVCVGLSPTPLAADQSSERKAPAMRSRPKRNWVRGELGRSELMGYLHRTPIQCQYGTFCSRRRMRSPADIVPLHFSSIEPLRVTTASTACRLPCPEVLQKADMRPPCISQDFCKSPNLLKPQAQKLAKDACIFRLVDRAALSSASSVRRPVWMRGSSPRMTSLTSRRSRPWALIRGGWRRNQPLTRRRRQFFHPACKLA